MSVTGGYSCPGCGIWVMLGASHSCGPTWAWPQPDPTLARIAHALERIAEVLEQQERRR